jgi:hypothetical protein
MTSGSAGGLKNREPFKADSTEGHLEKVFDWVPGRGQGPSAQKPWAFFKTRENKL